MIDLVAKAFPAQVGSASAVIVADTCPPASVCDRRYPVDAVVVIVPSDPQTELLALHVFGQERPEEVAPWVGPLPEHVSAML
jgi:hypothetical protein